MTVLTLDMSRIVETCVGNGKRYSVKVWLTPPDDSGQFSIVAANLPGVASCGDSEDDAIANFRDAFRLSLESYRAHGEDIPWDREGGHEQPDSNSYPRWLVIDAETASS